MSYNISNHFKISIMQHNCARNTANIHTYLEIGLERNIVWWGGWSPHHFSLHYSLCLETSILRHLHTRIRESILSISLSSRLSTAIGQSPYQSRVLAVTSRCVYKPSVV